MFSKMGIDRLCGFLVLFILTSDLSEFICKNLDKKYGLTPTKANRGLSFQERTGK
jgi:hypothetical protein